VRPYRPAGPEDSGLTAATAALGVVTLDFDPIAVVGSLAIRLEALALAGIFFVAVLAWAARMQAPPGGRRSEDLLLVLLAVIPGAIVGGRLVHALSFADVYATDP
jgi:prolipoprotein diacylglyceryltransferase